MSAALKARLRHAALASRAAITPQTHAEMAIAMVREGLGLAESLLAAPIIAAYWPIRDEADTRPLLAALAAAGYATALPVTGARGTALKFRLWRDGDAQILGQMNIPEPAAHLPEVEPDLLFIPLAAFDRRGQRIGYGAGHYDCTLAALRAKKPVLAVGVGFLAQEIALVPQESHDAPLDFVLTERGLLTCGATCPPPKHGTTGGQG